MSAGYNGQDWLLLGAIAAETRLGFTVLEAMGIAREVLERHQVSGVVVVDGEIELCQSPTKLVVWILCAVCEGVDSWFKPRGELHGLRAQRNPML